MLSFHKPKVISSELQAYIKNNFVYKDGEILRYDKKKHTTGSIDAYGYLIIKVKGIQIKAHHIAWFLNYGEFPIMELDHIDRNRLNNKIENLRLADRIIQNRNHNKKPNPKTGVIGVYYDEVTKGLKKRYTFKHNGKSYRFYNLEDAIKAKEKLNGCID